MASAAAAVASSYGDGKISGAHLDGSSSNRAASPYAPSSRYDPKSMDRIIADANNNLNGYDSDLSEDTEAAEVRVTKRRQIRTNVIAASVAGIILVAASVAIGVLAVVQPNSIKLPWSNNNNTPGRKSGANFQVAYQAPEQQRLLELAQQVLSACSESKLNEDISDCQHLCRSNLCCFEKGQYSCEDDEEKECAVYAGCEALMEGVPMSGVPNAHRNWG